MVEVLQKRLDAATPRDVSRTRVYDDFEPINLYHFSKQLAITAHTSNTPGTGRRHTTLITGTRNIRFATKSRQQRHGNTHGHRFSYHRAH